MRPKVKVGLVGIAGYGDSYLEALFRNERGAAAEIVGVADPAPHRCRRLDELHHRRIPIHASMSDLLASSAIDLVIISTPIHLHASQTCLALEAGANVLCEKPLSGSLPDAYEMLRCQRSVKGFAAIGFQWSFVPAIQSLKRDIFDGVLGRPIRLKTIVFFPRGRSYFNRNDWAGRITTPRGHQVLDSPVNNATSHYLHNMLYVLGAARETSATPHSVQAEVYRANDIENYDTAAVRVRTHGGVEVLFYTTHATRQRVGPTSSFEFENAVVEYDDAAAPEFVARFHDGRVKRYGNPNLDRNEKIWQSIDAVATGAAPACGIAAALPHTLCVAAIQRSVIDIPTFPEERMTEVTAGEEPMVVVDGLHEALVDSYQHGLLPAEVGTYDWAKPQAPVDLTQPEWAVQLGETPVTLPT